MGRVSADIVLDTTNTHYRHPYARKYTQCTIWIQPKDGKKELHAVNLHANVFQGVVECHWQADCERKGDI